MSGRAASTRDAILAAAVPVLGRYGYRRTTVDMVARAAGVSRAAVYQYFDGKAGIYRAVTARVGEGMLEAAETDAESGGTVAERLYSVLAAKLEFVVDNVEADYRDELAVEATAVASDVIVDIEARFSALVESILRSARDEIDLLDQAITAADAAALFIDAMVGIARSTDSPERMRERLRQLVELGVRGLTTHRTSRSTP